MLTHGFSALSVGRGTTEPGRISSPLGEPEGYGPARRADGSPGEEGPSGTGAEGLPAAGRDRFSIIALQRVCLPDRLDGLEGTDRPSRKSLDGSAGQSLADDRFFLTSASG